MFSNSTPANPRILVVRLGAMGDVIHAFPAVATLKQSFPQCRITWVIEPRWEPLLEGNPHVDRIVLLDRRSVSGIARCWRELRSEPYDLAIDFQGLIKSALAARSAKPKQIWGFDRSQLRESAAGFFYTRHITAHSTHVVDRNLELAAAAGASSPSRGFPVPQGRPEGELPPGDFVLASPQAGWGAKQWPSGHYAALASALPRELGLPLVLNLPPLAPAPDCPGALVHRSSLQGLIHATRRAVAVIGVDSGPLHLAAAAGKPGVAIFGPTDPARNGPYGDLMVVLRAPDAQTTYRRGVDIDSSMQRISPEQVLEALKSVLRRCPV